MKYWRKVGKEGGFGEVDVGRPERRDQAGRLLVVGGNDNAFYAVAGVAEKAKGMGIGEVRVLLPDSLKKKLPVNEEIIFAPSGGSGGFGKGAVQVALAAAEWSDYVLLAGDLGGNAETTVWAGEFVRELKKPILITRDSVDAVAGVAGEWLEKSDISLLLTLPQLQKVMRAVYYPKVITLLMPLNQLVEVLHKFTISYPVLIVIYHSGQVVVAKGGEVASVDIADTGCTPISLWAGDLAVRMVGLSMWNPGKSFEVAVRALIGYGGKY